MHESPPPAREERRQALKYCDELIAYYESFIGALANERNAEPLLQHKRDIDNSISAYEGVVERLQLIRKVLAPRGRAATRTTL